MLKVFVYGTLLEGEGNHGVIADMVDDIQPATLPGHDLHFYGTPTSFPYIREANDDAIVIGEVFYFADADADAALHRLDSLESHPRFYERKETVVDVNGVEETVFVYTMPEHRQRDGGQVFMNNFRRRFGGETSQGSLRRRKENERKATV